MSQFSEKLKLLIKENGIKIYQLSKNSGLDRTTIQRAISGERLPSVNFMEQLSDYLRLSPIEKEELFNLYSISKIGEKVYTGRKYIKEMIEKFATIQSNVSNINLTKKNITYSGLIHEDISFYEGQYHTNNMIRDVLEDEVANSLEPQINVSVPFNFNFLIDLLYQLYIGENCNISIKNVINFNKLSAFQNSNYNLEILSGVLPFAFTGGKGYQVYYYYDNSDKNQNIAAIMPYYIITSKRLITLSADFKTAILYNNVSIVNLYKNNFDIIVKKSTPLIIHHNNCEDILNSYLESYNSFGTISHIIEPQPCFSMYYTAEIVNSHLRQDVDNRELLLKLLSDLYLSYKTIVRPMSIFSAEGLSYFAQTGILSDLPTQYAIPFTIDERIMLLGKLRNDIISDVYRVYAANSSKFMLPFISIQLYCTNGIDFFTTNNNGFLSSAYINEKSIAEVFYDFLESLPESDLIYDKNETLKIIDSCINYCKQIKSS